MSFAAVFIPEFPVAAWLLDEPHLHAQPLALLNGTPPQESIASLNAVAVAYRLAHGMTKAQAETGCAARFRSRDSRQEMRAFDCVLETVGRFTPRAEAVASPANEYAGQDRLAAALLLDASGTSSLFGDAPAYAWHLRDALAAAGFEAHVAVAPNAEAALIFARSRESLTCVQQRELRTRLAPLPVSLLPCEAKTHALLRRWGIGTLGQLAALPDDGLVSRLGQAGRRLQQLARGEARHLLAPAEAAFTLTEGAELDSPLDNLERLLFVLSRLLGDAVHKAVEHAYAVRALSVSLVLERGEPHTVRIAPAVATQNRDALLKLLKLELEASPPSAEVIAVQLEAEPAQPQIAQRGLFQSQFPDPDRLDLLLARLKSIAGAENVGSAELANTHADDAFTMVPFRPEQGSPDTLQVRREARPALRRFRPPQDAYVQTRDGCPERLYWRGERLRLTSAAGPWHVAGSWWDSNSFECDFWDVVTEAPHYSLRLRRQHGADTWAVVGLYD